MNKLPCVEAGMSEPPSSPMVLVLRPHAPKAWHVRLLIALSAPVMLSILLLVCVWMWVMPTKRRQLRALAARVSTPCPWYVAAWLFAVVLLDRWPLLVLAIVGTGGLLGLLIAGPSASVLGVASAILGASLAPVFARDLPAWLFPRS